MQGPWAGHKRDGAAYVMPDWVGRMPSYKYIRLLHFDSHIPVTLQTADTSCFRVKLMLTFADVDKFY